MLVAVTASQTSCRFGTTDVEAFFAWRICSMLSGSCRSTLRIVARCQMGKEDGEGVGCQMPATVDSLSQLPLTRSRCVPSRHFTSTAPIAGHCRARA